jgi:hypothetical protein
MNDNLMCAILSMDAYNRGYNAGINLSGDQVGNATILQTSLSLGTTIVDDKEIGIDQEYNFYGIAYSYDGGVVISYRGTDDYVMDPYYGWPLGGGNENAAQASLALQFYKLVVERLQLSVGDNAYLDANIALTGHSLSGGLAGYVAEIYDKDAVLFDAMSFDQAAQDTYTRASGYNVTWVNLTTGKSTTEVISYEKLIQYQADTTKAVQE